MAVTFTPTVVPSGVTVHDVADLQVMTGTLAFSGSYATGGDALDFTALLAQSGVGVADYVKTNLVNGWLPQYDYTNKKLRIWDLSTDAELAAAAYPAGLTGASPRALVIGR